MGRGRSGVLKMPSKSHKGEIPLWGSTYYSKHFDIPQRKAKITSNMVELAQTLTEEQLVAALFPAARPSTPREQTPASDHQEGSTPQASQAS